MIFHHETTATWSQHGSNTRAHAAERMYIITTVQNYNQHLITTSMY